jgi:hypothetical protein
MEHAMRVAVSIVVVSLATAVLGQAVPTYDTLIQQGKVQLQAGNNVQALSTAEQAIQIDVNRWEGYALAGGALMNLKRHEQAADRLSKAIDLAPQDKQTGLRDLRRQCLLAESGTAPASPPSTAPVPGAAEATTTQAEIVLWKSIENSTNTEDFKTYLSQYPNGAFAALARRHLADAEELEKKAAAERAASAAAGTTISICVTSGPVGMKGSCGHFNVHPGGVRFVGSGKGIRQDASAEDFSADCSGIEHVESGHNVHIKDYVLLRVSGKSYYIAGFPSSGGVTLYQAGSSTSLTSDMVVGYIKQACPSMP